MFSKFTFIAFFVICSISLANSISDPNTYVRNFDIAKYLNNHCRGSYIILPFAHAPAFAYQGEMCFLLGNDGGNDCPSDGIRLVCASKGGFTRTEVFRSRYDNLIDAFPLDRGRTAIWFRDSAGYWVEIYDPAKQGTLKINFKQNQNDYGGTIDAVSILPNGWFMVAVGANSFEGTNPMRRDTLWLYDEAGRPQYNQFMGEWPTFLNHSPLSESSGSFSTLGPNRIYASDTGGNRVDVVDTQKLSSILPSDAITIPDGKFSVKGCDYWNRISGITYSSGRFVVLKTECTVLSKTQGMEINIAVIDLVKGTVVSAVDIPDLGSVYNDFDPDKNTVLRWAHPQFIETGKGIEIIATSFDQEFKVLGQFPDTISAPTVDLGRFFWTTAKPHFPKFAPIPTLFSVSGNGLFALGSDRRADALAPGSNPYYGHGRTWFPWIHLDPNLNIKDNDPAQGKFIDNPNFPSSTDNDLNSLNGWIFRGTRVCSDKKSNKTASRKLVAQFSVVAPPESSQMSGSIQALPNPGETNAVDLFPIDLRSCTTKLNVDGYLGCAMGSEGKEIHSGEPFYWKGVQRQWTLGATSDPKHPETSYSITFKKDVTKNTFAIESSGPYGASFAHDQLSCVDSFSDAQPIQQFSYNGTWKDQEGKYEVSFNLATGTNGLEGTITLLGNTSNLLVLDGEVIRLNSSIGCKVGKYASPTFTLTKGAFSGDCAAVETALTLFFLADGKSAVTADGISLKKQ